MQLTINHTPPVLAPPHLLTVDNDGFLGSNHSERNDILDLSIERTFLFVQLVVIVGVHLQVVEGELLLDSLLESSTLLHGERVRLRNDGDNIDDIGELL